jgi:hypothetical protein
MYLVSDLSGEQNVISVTVVVAKGGERLAVSK